MKLSLKGRYEVLKSKGLPFTCLKSGHLKSACQHKSYFTYGKSCHPSIVHLDPRQSKESETSTFGRPDQNNNSILISSSAISSTEHMEAGDHTRQALPIVPVIVKSRNSDKFVTIYAFLDSGSTATFCTTEIAKALHLKGRKTTLNLTTMGQLRTESCYVLNDLEVSELNGEHTIELPSIYAQPNLPVSKKDIVTSEDLQKWPHLCDVHISTIDSDVGLLIGVNVPKAIKPWDVISSADEGPFAVKNALGWVINGPLDVGPDSNTCTYNTYVTVNRIDARLEEQVRYQFNQEF